MMLPPDPVFIFKGDMDSVMCLSYRITSKVEYIYTGTQSGKVHVWNLKTYKEVGNFKSGEDSCLSVNVPEDEEDPIITQNKSGIICFWKENNNQWSLLNEIKTEFFGFCKAVIFKDIFYTSLKDSKCLAISVKMQKALRTCNLSNGDKLGEIMAFKVFDIEEKLYLLVAYEGLQLILWSLENDIVKISSLQVSNCPMSIDFDVKTSKGICGNPSDEIQIFTLSKSMELKTLRTVKLVNEGVATVQIRPDSKLVAAGCWDGKLRLYSWKTFTLLAALDLHSLTVQDICFFKYMRKGSAKYLLLAGSKDSRMTLWDIYN